MSTQKAEGPRGGGGGGGRLKSAAQTTPTELLALAYEMADELRIDHHGNYTVDYVQPSSVANWYDRIRILATTGWQPVEKAPKDGTWVLLKGGTDWGGEPVGPCVVAFWYEPESDWCYAYWDGAWRSAYQNPTHWMPLPKAPTAGEGRG